MLVRNWMTSDVITIGPDTSLLKLTKVMRDNDVRRLPVVDKDGTLVGIISDRDVRDASPSKATTLDMYEMHYLLAEIRASNIMTRNPLTIKPTDTVEMAAMIMLDHKIGGLPVVEDGRLLGIIAEQDVFKALVNITGVRVGGFQIGFAIENRPGALKPIFDLVRRRGARILSVLTSDNDEGQRHIFLRLRDMPTREEEDALVAEVGEHCELLYWVKDKMHLA